MGCEAAGEGVELGEELVEEGVGCWVGEGVVGVSWVGGGGRRGEDGENAAGWGVNVVKEGEEGVGVFDHLSSISAIEDRTHQRGGPIRWPATIMSGRGYRIPQTLKRLILRLRFVLIRHFQIL